MNQSTNEDLRLQLVPSHFDIDNVGCSYVHHQHVRGIVSDRNEIFTCEEWSVD